MTPTCLRGTITWTCQKWSDDAVRYVARKLALPPDAVSSALLLKHVGEEEELTEAHGNLLLNEGINLLWDLAIGAGGTPFNNANAYVGVGDSSTAATAAQTELQAATNRFYKAMNASYPSRSGQTVTWQADFTTSEANYAWNEGTIASGATTASGSGFLNGTTNLDRKASLALGTKSAGVWTLSPAITLS